jgi:hypothetical protein
MVPCGSFVEAAATALSGFSGEAGICVNGIGAPFGENGLTETVEHTKVTK